MVLSAVQNYFAPDLGEDAGFDNFEKWLRVYQKGSNIVDSNGRTIWYFDIHFFHSITEICIS